MQVDTFAAYVRAELDHWGREFALHRDCDYLGHQSKNLLAVLIEHKGDMPGRAQGYKPLAIDVRAQAVEDIVGDIAKWNPIRACVLRGYYCGSGRRAVERREMAEQLIQRATGDATYRISRQKYFSELECGLALVMGYLQGQSRAA